MTNELPNPQDIEAIKQRCREVASSQLFRLAYATEVPDAARPHLVALYRLAYEGSRDRAAYQAEQERLQPLFSFHRSLVLEADAAVALLLRSVPAEESSR